MRLQRAERGHACGVPHRGILFTFAEVTTMSRSIPSRRRFLQASAAALGAGAGRSAPLRAGGESTTLRELADARWLWLGPAAGSGPLTRDPAYGPVLAQEFNILTPENEM